MPVSRSLHTDVRDLLFADWAEVVTFIEVSRIYDPAIGQSSELLTETDVLAITGPGLREPEPNTAHQCTRLQRSFLIRTEDLPDEASFTSSRIRCQGREYTILTADQAQQTNLFVFNTLARDT